MPFNLHPLAGGSPRNLLARLHEYGSERHSWPRIATSLTMSLLGEPGRFFVKHAYRSRLESLHFQADPIFILGHWRSGTTYLHHLMSLDPQFCYVSSYHAWLPELFIINDWLSRTIVRSSMPSKRPMDNIELSLEKPEEEEFPLAATGVCSYIDSFYFPKNTREIFERSVLFQGLSEQEYEQWKQAYLRILKFSCLSMPGNQPLLKSPANTARIRALLQLFPNAKFVHIYRNPYTVFASKLHTLKRMTRAYGLQVVSEDELRENVLWIYRQVMQRFFEDKKLVPAENLIEFRYEDFVADPLATLSTVYEKFELEGFEATRPQFQRYIEAQDRYQKNPHHIDADMVRKIYENWEFAIDEWGYKAPV